MSRVGGSCHACDRNSDYARIDIQYRDDASSCVSSVGSVARIHTCNSRNELVSAHACASAYLIDLTS